MSMSGFAARGNAVEGSFFRKEQEFALRKQLERLVAAGQLPESALQQHTPLDLANRGPHASTSHVSVSDVPVSVFKGRPASDYVYQHVKGVVPGKSTEVSKTRPYSLDLTILLSCSAQAHHVLVDTGHSY